MSFSVAAALVLLVDFIWGLPFDGPDIEVSIADSFGSILFGPAIETLLMVALLLFVTEFTDRIILPAFLCAFIFSLMHSMSHPLWGVFTFIPFVIFSIAFLVWRQNSTKTGFTVAFSTHALHNSFMVLIGFLTK
ncbi:hypothetical protein [Vibrio maritimus]|uniref:hypothetical protein n=1 Tax=Vibrio maritimus TaxID=990268 RepID=UPI003735258E